MDCLNKNNITIFVTSCLFFIMIGIVGTGAMIYDITQNSGEYSVASGIMLAIFLGLVSFPIVAMICMLIVYIFKIRKNNRYTVMYD